MLFADVEPPSRIQISYNARPADAFVALDPDICIDAAWAETSPLLTSVRGEQIRISVDDHIAYAVYNGRKDEFCLEEILEQQGTLIVTGGSRGIGAAVAKLGASHGYRVAVNYQSNEAAAKSVVGEIKAAGGCAIAVAGDVAKEADVLRLFATAERDLGPICALVNNAGITGTAGRVEAIELRTLQRVLEVNVVGAVLCAREAVRRMSTRKGGKGGAIVNLGSRASELGGAGEWVHYALSKGAIDTFTIGLAREVGAEGVRVNAVSPGLIDTELHAAAGVADRLPRLSSSIPIPRIGTAAEVAEGVIWLLSPAASYVTGAILHVSGGR